MTSRTVKLLALISAIGSVQAQTPADYTRFVNPFIGTDRMGHTYPGATVPFGMVQLSPETDTIPYATDGRYNKPVYEYCAGYQYRDKTIVGFSHTHFSGTGHSDLGDILVMPATGPLQLNPGTADHPTGGFRSAFSHADEHAEPGYYSVMLGDNGIRAELTATARTGMHSYTFPASDSAHIIIDLAYNIYNYDHKNIWTYLRFENDTLITGYRQTSGWARTRTVYFAIAFSKPFRHFGGHDFSPREPYRGFWGKWDTEHDFPELAGRQIRAWVGFDTRAGEQVMMKVGLSAVDVAGAIRNMQSEIPGWDFDAVRRRAHDAWNEALGKVQVTMMNDSDMTSFYTSVYHTFLAPTIYMDTDGRYRGLDQQIHTADGFTNYTTFSLWDTYRAQHPWLSLITPSRNDDMIRSMLAHYDQSAWHMLPVWSHYANENWCMTGYHAVAVIADAVINGSEGFDQDRALDACIATASDSAYGNLRDYLQLGYVPAEKSGNAVSQTLEYAYDDWAIAQLAKKLGNMKTFEAFNRRAESWRNVYNAGTGFMCNRTAAGAFRANQDVLSTEGQGFIEGNAWNYSLYVPQDPGSMITLMGGKKRFASHLDSLFTMNLPDRYFAETEDITRDGMIGNYVHGNEPSHHVAYLYNWCNEPWKTQSTVRMVMRRMYRAAPDGLGGNDDCGQMSAWYVFSALGFYPVAPASGEYALGSPLVRSATIRLENGKTFVITVHNQSERNVYVQKVLLNGIALSSWRLSSAAVRNGGTLDFYMGAKPKKTATAD